VIKVSIHDESGSSVHIEADGKGRVIDALNMAARFLDRKLETGRWLADNSAKTNNDETDNE